MYLDNYQLPIKKETLSLIILFLFSVLLRIPVILLYGDTSLENEWGVIFNNLIQHANTLQRGLYLFSILDCNDIWGTCRKEVLKCEETCNICEGTTRTVFPNYILTAGLTDYNRCHRTIV